MATLYTEQRSNTQKTWLLMTVFLVLVIALGWLVSYYYNNPALLYVAIIFSLVMNFASYWWSDKVVLSLAGAKPASHDGNMELYHLVENLSITAGLPMPKLYIITDPAPNAFATGRDKKHAVVAVTTGLLTMLNKNELEGVIAHELSHIGNRDILLSSVIVVLVGLIAILSDMFVRSRFIFGNRNNNKGGGLMAILGLVFIILSPIIATIIQLAVSRQREYLADSSGALLTRYPEGLASALEKIGSYNQPMKKASNAMAHLYISNPFGPQKVKGISKLFMTHPPIEERVQKLRHFR
jgi:heat shock protein HtpX